MNRNDMFYQMKNGDVISNGELEDSFYHTHGYRRNENEHEFLKFLYNLLGTVIVKAVRAYDIQVQDLAKIRPILAVQLYRDRYHVTVREAYDYVNAARAAKEG